jgi:hypothetical protein
MMTLLRALCGLVVVSVLLTGSPALGQESKSAAPAAELARLLNDAKLDSIAAQHGSEDQFVGALYFPGTQLLVVTARFSVPQQLSAMLAQKNYREVYIDLNSASIVESKVFVSDLGANGLRFRRENNQPPDTVDLANRSITFDGDWRKAKLSEDEYTKLYLSSDEQYVQMLQALIAQLKKGS